MNFWEYVGFGIMCLLIALALRGCWTEEPFIKIETPQVKVTIPAPTR